MPCKKSIISAVVLFAVVLATSVAVKASESKLTLAYIGGKGTELYITMTNALPEKIKAATKGKVEIILNYSLVKGPQLAQSVRDGRVQMASVISAYYSVSNPEFSLATLPGLINNFQELKTVFNAFWRDDMDKVFAKKYNSRVLLWGLHCPQNLVSRMPIKSVADFKGKKIRVHNIETGALVAVLGGKPTPMAASEVIPALQRGIIDGVFTSSCWAFDGAFYSVAKYVEYWPVSAIIPFAIVINNDVWKKLPKEVQQAMVEVCRKMEQESFDGYVADLEGLPEKWAAKGVKYYVVPDAAAKELFQKKYLEPVYTAYYARAKKEGFDGKKYVERALKAIGRASLY